MHVCVCVHLSADTCRGEKKAADLWSWNYRQDLNSLMPLLEIHLKLL